MVYLMSVPGGGVADRLIGVRRAVLAGGIVIAAGHYGMAVPARSSAFAGMTLIVFGTGLRKPTGRLGTEVNWHLGFAVAAVGMTLAVIQDVIGWRWLGEAGTRVANPLPPDERRGDYLRTGVIVGALVLIALVLGGVGWLTVNVVVNTLAVVTVAVAVSYLARAKLDRSLTDVRSVSSSTACRSSVMYASQMTGRWFLATAVGDAVGGQAARLSGDRPLPTYLLTFGLASVALGPGAFVLTTLIRTLTAGVH